MTCSGQRVFDREVGIAQNIWKMTLLSSTLRSRLNIVVDRLQKKKKCLQFFKYFAIWLCQPLGDGVFFPTCWIWAALWLGLAGRMGQKVWYARSKPQVVYTSAPLLLFCLQHENNTELTCWRWDTVEQSWVIPAEAILDQPFPADFPAGGRHMSKPSWHGSPFQISLDVQLTLKFLRNNKRLWF